MLAYAVLKSTANATVYTIAMRNQPATGSVQVTLY
jgi:hypothetical protein